MARGLPGAAVTVFVLAACQQSAPWQPPVVEDPPAECEGDGAGCTGQCCEPGYSCQRGQCIDASSDFDGDGYAAYQDCDDFEDSVHPAALELCDDLDNNCNGTVDEGVRDQDGNCALCQDRDGDGFLGCDDDCDDDDPATSPLAPELCDGIDNDCDGQRDEGFDLDGDGFAPCGAQADCDDADPLAAPGFLEVCDGRDNDCDGAVDQGELCGTRAGGECLEGVCTWDFEATGTEAWHECGQDQGNFRCSSASCAEGELLLAAPVGGLDELPVGSYDAVFRTKIDRYPAESECSRALVLRLRLVDLDSEEDVGCQTCLDTCADCYQDCEACFFGGETQVIASTNYFEAVDTVTTIALPFTIDDRRSGHRIVAVALVGSCLAAEVCLRRIKIVAA